MDRYIRIQILGFYDDYSMLSGMLSESPTCLLKEMTQDFNDLINHTMSTIINNSQTMHTPNVLGHSLKYIVNSYAEAGGVLDQKSALDVRRELGRLAEAYLISLSENFGWCTHHLMPMDGHVTNEGADAMITLVVKYGPQKADLISTHEQEIAISPSVQHAIMMMVGRL